MISQSAATRICTTCLQERPLTDFRRRRSGSQELHGDCRHCHNTKENQRHQRRKHKEFRQLAQNINRARTPNEIVACFGPGMIYSLGGSVAFIAAWHEHLTTAMQDRPGARDVLAAFRAIAKLATSFQDVREEQRKRYLAGRTAEDRDKELKKLFAQFVGQCQSKGIDPVETMCAHLENA
jgi:hypothetical protein